jgi:hypothetical protein
MTKDQRFLYSDYFSMNWNQQFSNFQIVKKTEIPDSSSQIQLFCTTLVLGPVNFYTIYDGVHKAYQKKTQRHHVINWPTTMSGMAWHEWWH